MEAAPEGSNRKTREGMAYVLREFRGSSSLLAFPFLPCPMQIIVTAVLKFASKG